MLYGYELRNNLHTIVEQYKIEHFTVKEILNTLEKNTVPGLIPVQYINNLAIPLLVWDIVRSGTGLKIRLTSTYRDAVRNKHKDVKGRPNSLHLIAAAIDGEAVDGRSDWKIQKFIDSMELIIVLPNGRRITKKNLGLGFYPGFTHIDSRGLHNRYSPVKWDRR